MGVYNRARSFQQPRGSMPRNDRIVRVETVKRALLSSRQGVLLKVLADRHEWKLRNLYRDIDALDAAGYIIRHENNRYWIEGSPERAASAPDADERLALYLARQNARAWKETSLGKALDRLWHRVSADAAAHHEELAIFFSARTP